jgi:hypothetical protein
VQALCFGLTDRFADWTQTPEGHGEWAVCAWWARERTGGVGGVYRVSANIADGVVGLSDSAHRCLPLLGATVRSASAL